MNVNVEGGRQSARSGRRRAAAVVKFFTDLATNDGIDATNDGIGCERGRRGAAHNFVWRRIATLFFVLVPCVLLSPLSFVACLCLSLQIGAKNKTKKPPQDPKMETEIPFSTLRHSLVNQNAHLPTTPPTQNTTQGRLLPPPLHLHLCPPVP
jgi:hypothetical protein